MSKVEKYLPISEPENFSNRAPEVGSERAPASQTNRRDFLKIAGLGAGAAALTFSGIVPGAVRDAQAKEVAPFNTQFPGQRIGELIEIRTRAAVQASQEEAEAFPHKTNGDEELYANQAFAGNFSKTLPHDPHTGLVVPSAYQSLLNALKAGTMAAFDQVPAGGPGQLAGPLSPLMFQMEGE
ncbi:MAG: twin-arginine translocation signal domain-containing protein, partial [Blastocatellia bacterium]